MNIEQLFNKKVDRRNFLKASGTAAGMAVFNPIKIGRFLEKSAELIPPTIVMYHEVTYEFVRNDFVSRLQKGEIPISPETYIGILNGEIELPKGVTTFMPTADDGRLSQYDSFRRAVDYVQRERGIFIPVTFFVLTMFNKLIDEKNMSMEDIPDDTPCFNDGVNNYMAKVQIIQLIKDGHTIGNHGVNHWFWPSKTELNRNIDIDQGDERIQQLYDIAGVKRNCKLIAYPFGGVTTGILNRVSEQGYDCGFITDPQEIDASLKRFAISRTRLS